MAARMRPYIRREEQQRCEDPLNLRNFEECVYSQQGEDGIIREIFRRIGPGNRRFLEFGVTDGTECNTRRLVEHEGWRGTWIEGDPDAASRAVERFSDVQVISSYLRLDNIIEIVQAAGVPIGLDLLSIDVDGNDYWFLLALGFLRPRVLIIEYNARWLPPRRWIMPYNSNHVWDRSDHMGASLQALYDIGVDLGYRLVACDSKGVNAFFVRDDEVVDRFTHSADNAFYHYVSPKYQERSFGHYRRHWYQRLIG
jgi:hypothetical protein